jgi:hypothetical protein
MGLVSSQSSELRPQRRDPDRGSQDEMALVPTGPFAPMMVADDTRLGRASTTVMGAVADDRLFAVLAPQVLREMNHQNEPFGPANRNQQSAMMMAHAYVRARRRAVRNDRGPRLNVNRWLAWANRVDEAATMRSMQLWMGTHLGEHTRSLAVRDRVHDIWNAQTEVLRTGAADTTVVESLFNSVRREGPPNTVRTRITTPRLWTVPVAPADDNTSEEEV